MNNRFEHYLRYVGSRCAKTTTKRVRVMLSSLVEYLQRHHVKQWHEVTTEHLRSWIIFKGKSVKPRTNYSYKQEAKYFFEWMYSNEYLFVNPWNETLEGLKPEYVMRRVPTKKETITLLEKVSESVNNAKRDRAILELVYSSGLRRCEVYKLNVSDVRDEWIKVRGKGDRERFVPLGKQAQNWIKKYLCTERIHVLSNKNHNEEALFLSRYGRRLGIDTYNHILRKSGLNKVSTMHGLRHACATHMLENGASIRVLQKLLGHRKLSSTEIYTKVDRSHLNLILPVYHPRG